MRVIRLEIRNLPYKGVYMRHGDYIQDSHPAGGWADLPAPIVDRGLRRYARDYEVCCCNSFEQFDEWWPTPVLHKLAHVNLWGDAAQVDVVVFESDGVAVGEMQCLLMRDRCCEVHRMPVEKFVQLTRQQQEDLLGRATRLEDDYECDGSFDGGCCNGSDTASGDAAVFRVSGSRHAKAQPQKQRQHGRVQGPRRGHRWASGALDRVGVPVHDYGRTARPGRGFAMGRNGYEEWATRRRQSYAQGMRNRDRFFENPQHDARVSYGKGLGSTQGRWAGSLFVESPTGRATTVVPRLPSI